MLKKLLAGATAVAAAIATSAAFAQPQPLDGDPDELAAIAAGNASRA